MQAVPAHPPSWGPAHPRGVAGMHEQDVCRWVTSLHISSGEAIAATFKQEEISGEVLLTISESDLKEMGLSLGARRKILSSLAELKAAAEAAHARAAASTAPELPSCTAVPDVRSGADAQPESSAAPEPHASGVSVGIMAAIAGKLLLAAQHGVDTHSYVDGHVELMEGMHRDLAMHVMSSRANTEKARKKRLQDAEEGKMLASVRTEREERNIADGPYASFGLSIEAAESELKIAIGAQGYLMKKSGIMSRWKPLWFSVTNLFELCYWDTRDKSQTEDPKGKLDLKGQVTIRSSVAPTTTETEIEFESELRTYRFRATTKEDASLWIRRLNLLSTASTVDVAMFVQDLEYKRRIYQMVIMGHDLDGWSPNGLDKQRAQDLLKGIPITGSGGRRRRFL